VFPLLPPHAATNGTAVTAASARKTACFGDTFIVSMNFGLPWAPRCRVERQTVNGLFRRNLTRVSPHKGSATRVRTPACPDTVTARAIAGGRPQRSGSRPMTEEGKIDSSSWKYFDSFVARFLL